MPSINIKTGETAVWNQMGLDINECTQKDSQMYFEIYI